MAPTPTDLFLSHDWGVNQANHKKVSVINDALKQRGFKTWFDVEEMHGDVDLAMTDGIENTKIVLSFITENYRDKINGDNALDNCRKEFQHSINCTKVPLCVVLEQSMRNPSEWRGKLGINCAGRMYVDMCGNVNDAVYLSGQMDLLCKELSVLMGKDCVQENNEATIPANQAPLYRYWHPKIVDHFYTTNFNELGNGKNGWNSEGVQCKMLSSQVSKSVPLYRYWSGSDHFYTTNANEIGTTTPGQTGKHGYKSEGVAGYCFSVQEAGTIPLYRYWKSNGADHFYTTNSNEIGTATSGQTGNHGYKSEGVACFVYPK